MHVLSYPCAGYAAQSLLAAIGCVQFVSNVIFASLVLKEQVGAPGTQPAGHQARPWKYLSVFTCKSKAAAALPDSGPV
jgi:hypothetical protein